MGLTIIAIRVKIAQILVHIYTKMNQKIFQKTKSKSKTKKGENKKIN